MHPHKSLSSYLVKPDLSPHQRLQWDGFRTNFIQIRRHNPRLLSRSLGAIAIWTIVIGSIRYIDDPGSLTPPAISRPSATQASLTQPTTLTTATAPVTLATVAHAPALPGGPSGELLPPGTMAPDHTYRNSYARGQCTWYVAGRRQVPGNWGNAASWYYHAVANRWNVGVTPAVAAIAWTPSGRYGHVALVEKVSANGTQVYISEMNYRGIGVKSYRWVSTKSFKYIY